MKRVAAILLVLALSIALIALSTGTRGGLAYFSPDTLEYYTQSEFTILGGIPLWRSFAEPSRRDVIDTAVRNGWIRPVKSDKPRWELVFHWNAAWRDGDGELYDVLCKHDEAIMEWSRQHPDIAEIYWQESFVRLQSTSESERSVGRQLLRTDWRCETIEKLDREFRSIRREYRLPAESLLPRS